ncbi:MAG TPA: sodium/proline symporter [Vicinamibacterales bacterium]|jgi:SSS family transporter|nr:sodium/proline symporter [Vicinamibacterales bacterium]|tara:strand:- start:818 stop:2239 length:1422 start_codon:yes stop_codon:yes gene_type:complete
MIITSFVIFLAMFVAIGVASTLRSDRSSVDYLVASRSVSPWLVGLSAMATNNSGYMFIGAIGYTYASGLESLWVMFAWMAGDFLASFFIHAKMRAVSQQRSNLSFGSLVATWGGDDFRKVRLLAGIITVLFLGAYAAAQFNASSKALYVVFGWDYSIGAILGSVLVLLYCLTGGIRASIWTDAAQVVVMFLAMAMMLVVGVQEIGGVEAFFARLGNVSPTYLNLFPATVGNGVLTIALFILGYVAGGVGIIAQPHVMIRFMALDDPGHMRKARTYYYSAYFAFCVLTFSVGLSARLIFPDTSAFDPELALPMMTTALLPEILVGLVLAGIVAASMSTADSQILGCSAALTEDIAGQRGGSVWFRRFATAVVTMVALAISLFGIDSVFVLVLYAWSVLAAAFAPLIILYALGEKLTETKALLVMTSCTAIALGWRALGWGAIIYEVAPAMVFGILGYLMFIKPLLRESGGRFER